MMISCHGCIEPLTAIVAASSAGSSTTAVTGKAAASSVAPDCAPAIGGCGPPQPATPSATAAAIAMHTIRGLAPPPCHVTSLPLQPLRPLIRYQQADNCV